MEFASIRQFKFTAFSVLALGNSFLARHLFYTNGRWLIQAAIIRISLADVLNLAGYGPPRNSEDWAEFKKALDTV